jgi:hypothetical protein
LGKAVIQPQLPHNTQLWRRGKFLQILSNTRPSTIAQGQVKHPLTGLFDPKFDIALNLTHTGLFDPKVDITLNLTHTKIFQHKVKHCFNDMEKTLEFMRLLPYCNQEAIGNAETGAKIISKVLGLTHNLNESSYIIQLKEYLDLSQVALSIQEQHLFLVTAQIS